MTRGTKHLDTSEAPAGSKEAGLRIRKPDETDGAGIWELVRNSGTLDVNSAYCYLMLGKYYNDTCAIAEIGGRPVGFVTGFRAPSRPDTWFVWQIAVDKEARGKGIARKLLDHVLERAENRDLQYIEATISPSNERSQSLFLGFARDRNVECRIADGFASQLFPGGAHEDEMLFRIGPIK
ncbi:diaminobutyrate acetyltransferase [Paenibacillus alkalitolerans]|uniref:diaminobutyrate acetyltransferase n=1 Tax=Paenibacillus alkalitolerans TaxID=2799335 RepID=UPI001F371C12|nr:diaminobutyrate acetyltransferase [Paenibacillus alkalitolerans]